MASAGETKVNRRELVETIDAQKEQITKYESRLRDLVRAYKGLAKEKEALEISLKAISGGSSADSGGQSKAEAKSEDEDRSSEASEASSHQEQQQPPQEQTLSKEQRLRNKVKALTSTLATLSSEKSRLEADFQEDRKKMVQDRKSREETMTKLKTDFEAFKAKTKHELDESKSKLIIEKHARDKDASDTQSMLRELQKLLSDERKAKEKLENINHELRVKAAEQAKEDERKKDVPSPEIRGQIDALKRENSAQKKEIEKLKKAADKAGVRNQELNAQLSDLQLVHRRDLERGEKKAEDSEARSTNLRKEHETRVVTLEARLQELSETVGNYDRIRQHDQNELDSLRDRVAVLTQENSTLSAASKTKTTDPADSSDIGLKAKTKEEILKLFGDIKREMIDRSIENEDEKKLKKEIRDLKSTIEDLRNELANVKSGRSSSAAASSSFLPEDDQEVVATLKARVVELQEKVSLSRSHLVESERDVLELRSRLKDADEKMVEIRAEERRRRDDVDNDYRSKIGQLEGELQKQRDRCLRLIEEKEDEVNMLKNNMEMVFDKAFSTGQTSPSPSPSKETQMRLVAATIASATSSTNQKARRLSSQSSITQRRSTSKSPYPDSVNTSIDLEDAAAALIKSSTEGGAGNSSASSSMLHYAQEIARKDVEIGQLREKIRGLESAMREVQLSSLNKEEKYSDKIEALTEEVARYRRMTAVGPVGGASGASDTDDKSGSNLEYLKNVVLRYMLSSDASSREHMLKAIATLLVFSNPEIKQVRDFNASWWWQQQQYQQMKKGHK